MMISDGTGTSAPANDLLSGRDLSKRTRAFIPENLHVLGPKRRLFLAAEREMQMLVLAELRRKIEWRRPGLAASAQATAVTGLLTAVAILTTVFATGISGTYAYLIRLSDPTAGTVPSKVMADARAAVASLVSPIGWWIGIASVVLLALWVWGVERDRKRAVLTAVLADFESAHAQSTAPQKASADRRTWSPIKAIKSLL